MKKTEVLSQLLSLTNTLFEAANYVMANVNMDSKMVLNDIKDALVAINASISLVFDDRKAEEIRQQSKKLQRACDALFSDSKAIDAFYKGFAGWKQLIETTLFMEAVNTANKSGKEEEETAIELLENLLAYNLPPQPKALAEFTLSRKLSYKNALRAYALCIDAFETDNALCEKISQEASPVHQYKYVKVDEVHFENCPICHASDGLPYYCAMPLYMINYTADFSPAKLWIKCASCGQLYAYNFPRKLVMPAAEEEELGDEIYMTSRPATLPILGRILKDILSHATGRKLLEVGAGTGELIAAALELGCEVEAVEISKRQSLRLRDLLGIQVHCQNFTEFNAAGKYNIITMGDVVEHVTDPNAALRKACELLEDDGILWISTPNYESAFSRIMKFNDPMWNEPWHITYFSYEGFKKLLCENGFDILDYSISSRYNGSMEIIARKHFGGSRENADF